MPRHKQGKEAPELGTENRLGRGPPKNHYVVSWEGAVKVVYK